MNTPSKSGRSDSTESEETSAFGPLVSDVTRRRDVGIGPPRVTRQLSNYLFPIEAMFFDDVIQFQECAGEIKLAYVTGKRIQLRLFDMTGESTFQSTKGFF